MTVSVTTRKRPWLAVVLAFVYPGLGHVYLRKWLRALLWFGLVITSSTLLVPEGIVPSTLTWSGLVEASKQLQPEAAFALFSITFFSMIDAYWMAKRTNQQASVEDGATCPHCGQEVDRDLDFCHWCTQPLSDVEQDS